MSLDATIPKSKRSLRILSIDTGTKRMGLAIWNPDSGLATPLIAIKRTKLSEDLEKIQRSLKEHHVNAILVGLPVTLPGQNPSSMQNAEFWAEKLKEVFKLPVFLHDESLTSEKAKEIMRRQGSKDKSKIDSIAAALLLEDFLSEQQ